MRDPQLGDDIDDYCVKCKRLTNHAIVSLLNGSAAKVRCRTCYSDHDFRHEQIPPSKKELKKAALSAEVAAGLPQLPSAPVPEVAAAPEPEPPAPAKKSRKKS